MLNFDFFQPFKHTTDSYGVLYLVLMNLPRSVRFKQENVIIVGIVPAFEKEPSTLNSFFLPLVNELKEFWTDGVRFNTAESPNYKLLFKAALMCVACDIPAARKCCGFKGHSANLGCSRCLKYFAGGFGKKDYSGFDRASWPIRTEIKHRETIAKFKACNTSSATKNIEKETGIKYSVLMELEYFDPIRFTIIDPMHNLFLGTAKYMMKNIWMENEILTIQHLKTIQTRVDTSMSPGGLGRLPRKIASSFGGFTAEQWKNWVTLFSLHSLQGILSDDHYHCWQAFVLACHLLCQKDLPILDLQKADLLLLKFCKDVERLYGKPSITPNMHLHAHLSECIKDYGSMCSFWLFSFERYNGILGNFPTNKKQIASQLMRRFIFEVECSHFQLPSMFQDQFISFFQIASKNSCLESETFYPLKNCYDLLHIDLPSSRRRVNLSNEDVQYMQNVYDKLYGSNAAKASNTAKLFKTIYISNYSYGSLSLPKTHKSAYVMSSWADDNGLIDTDSVRRPGKVLHYLLHKTTIEGKIRDHIFAVVSWFGTHPSHLHCGKPLEIWKTTAIPEGPATFLPIHLIHNRIVVVYGQFSSSGSQERVLYVSPIP